MQTLSEGLKAVCKIGIGLGVPFTASVLSVLGLLLYRYIRRLRSPRELSSRDVGISRLKHEKPELVESPRTVAMGPGR